MTSTSSWEEKKLSEIAVEIRGLVKPAAGEQYELWSVPSYATGKPEILDGAEIGSAKLQVQPWDVLVCKINPRINRVWIVGENSLGFPQIASPEWLVLRFPPEGRHVVAPFVASYLSAPKFRYWITGAVSGVTGSHTRAKAKEILQREIPFPPLVEQQLIVSTIRSGLDRVASGRASIINARRQCVLFRRAVADRAVLGRLIASAVSGTASVEQDLAVIARDRKLRAGKRRAQAQAAAVFRYEVPENWAIASVDQLCWDIEYGTSAKTREQAEPGSVPVLRMGNIRHSGIVMGNLKYLPGDSPDIASLMLEDGDLLFNRTNSAELVGKSAVYRRSCGPASFASYLIRCRFVESVNPDWVNLVINSSIGKSFVASVVTQQVGQANVNGTKLARMPIPFPCLAEQERILAALAEHRLMAARLEESSEECLRNADILKEEILSTAFSGRLA
jgi:type I restriction enzyme, S subunit